MIPLITYIGASKYRSSKSTDNSHKNETAIRTPIKINDDVHNFNIVYVQHRHCISYLPHNDFLKIWTLLNLNL